MSVVLMYHALYRGDDSSAIDQEDLPYAVSEENFIAQLDLIQSQRAGLYRSGDQPEIVITFDDGHRSNLDIAAHHLHERNLSAYFFITSDFLGKRRGFMNADQLRQLASMPGMQIGSHGVSHRFFDDMDKDASERELTESRQQLERASGQPCESISFPGGRYNEQTLRQLPAAGYKQWFGSAVGLVEQSEQFEACTDSDACQLLVQSARQPINRVAVRYNTSLDEFARMIAPDEAYFLQHRRRSQAKNLVRRILGNRLYHGLYKILSSR